MLSSGPFDLLLLVPVAVGKEEEGKINFSFS